MTSLNRCMEMFTATLLTTAKRWQQSKRPSGSEWIRKMWTMHTQGWYSALRKEGNSGTESTVLSETSQPQKATFQASELPGVGVPIRTESWTVAAEGRVRLDGHRVSVLQDGRDGFWCATLSVSNNAAPHV